MEMSGRAGGGQRLAVTVRSLAFMRSVTEARRWRKQGPTLRIQLILVTGYREDRGEGVEEGARLRGPSRRPAAWRRAPGSSGAGVKVERTGRANGLGVGARVPGT